MSHNKSAAKLLGSEQSITRLIAHIVGTGTGTYQTLHPHTDNRPDTGYIPEDSSSYCAELTKAAILAGIGRDPTFDPLILAKCEKEHEQLSYQGDIPYVCVLTSEDVALYSSKKNKKGYIANMLARLSLGYYLSSEGSIINNVDATVHAKKLTASQVGLAVIPGTQPGVDGGGDMGSHALELEAIRNSFNAFADDEPYIPPALPKKPYMPVDDCGVLRRGHALVRTKESCNIVEFKPGVARIGVFTGIINRLPSINIADSFVKLLADPVALSNSDNYAVR